MGCGSHRQLATWPPAGPAVPTWRHLGACGCERGNAHCPRLEKEEKCRKSQSISLLYSSIRRPLRPVSRRRYLGSTAPPRRPSPISCQLVTSEQIYLEKVGLRACAPGSFAQGYLVELSTIGVVAPYWFSICL